MARFRMPYIPVEDPFMTGISQGQQMMGQFVDPLMNTMIQAGQLRRQQEIDAENRSRYEDEMAMRQAEIDRIKGQRQEDIARAQGIRQEDLTSRYLTGRHQFALGVATEPIYNENGQIAGRRVNPKTYEEALKIYDQSSSNMPGYVPIPQPPEWSYQETMSPSEFNQVPKYYHSPERQFQIGKGTPKIKSPAQTATREWMDLRKYLPGQKNIQTQDYGEMTIPELGVEAGKGLYEYGTEPLSDYTNEIGRIWSTPLDELSPMDYVESAVPPLPFVPRPTRILNKGREWGSNIRNYFSGQEVIPEQEAMMSAPVTEFQMPEPMTTTSTRVQPRQRKRKQYSPYMQ